MASNGNTSGEAPSLGRATKEELVAKIEEMSARLRELEDQIAQRDAQLQTGDEGWLISTPNPEYSGRTLGVYFEKGHAFVPKRLPEAEKLVAKLTRDMGYSATLTTQGREAQPVAEKKMSVAEKLTQPAQVGMR